MYKPKPIDVSKIQLEDNLTELVEVLSKNTHEIWAQARIDEGWSYGEKRDDDAKYHPGLVPYSELSESEKEYDRKTTINVIKAMVSLGAEISFNNK